MSLKNVYFVPHPPIIMAEIGQQDTAYVHDTINAYHQIGRSIAKDKPETIVFVSPHGMSFENGTCFYDEPNLKGDFEMFGNSSVMFEKEVNVPLTEKIELALEAEDILNIKINREAALRYKKTLKLDHGVMVPMYFIDEYYQEYDIVHITPGNTSLLENYRIGMLINQCLSDSNYVLLCSGDLSHALKDSGPYAFHKNGPVFDRLVKDSIVTKNPENLLTLTEDFIESAAQCGLRSLLIGFGALDGRGIDAKVYSYEGPFGVGYLLSRLSPQEELASFYALYTEKLNQSYEERRSKESLYVALARLTMDKYLSEKKVIRWETFENTIGIGQRSTALESDLESLLNTKSGCFVSIHKNHQLRGCMGTIEPVMGSLFEEIAYNAVIAATEDPRFDEVTVGEMRELEISVDVLMPKEPVDTLEAFDVKRYGMIVEKGKKRGLLLPNLESIETVEAQYRICLDKAGILLDDGVKLYRFEVIRYH